MRRLLGFFGKLLFWGVVVAGLTAAGALLLVTRHLDEAVRAEVQRVFSEHYAGLHVSVRSAQRVEGQGLYVRGLSIKDPHLEGPRGELLYVDEIFMASNCAIEDLVLGDLQIDRISVRRPAVRAVRNSQGEWSIKNLLPFPSLGGAMPSATIEDGTLEIFDPTHNPPSTLTVRRINLEVEPPTASSTSGSPNLLGVKGTFAGDVFAETTVHGWLDPESGQWSARGEVKRLIVAPETWQTLPDVVASQLTGLGNLRGKADVQFDIVHRQIDVTTPLPLDHYLAEAPCQFHVRGKLVDGRYEDAGLPLPLRNISADFEISNQHLAVTNLLADGGSATLQLDLRRDGWADDSPLHLQAKARQFHVDDAVADVLPSELATVWRAYQPRGLMNADIVVDFDGEHWKPELTVHCLNTSFLYEAFPYPVSGTTGVISLKDDVLDFSLSAMASEKPVNMRGRFEDALATPVGWMEFHCDGPIPVDARMMAALDTPDLRYTRDLIASMNARGNVASSGRFDIVRLPSGATQLKEHIFFRISDASVEYEGFPFPVHHVSGEIELWNGQYTFREVKGENDSARIACTGSYLDDGKDPQLTLNYVCQDIPLEEELRRAFSPEIQDVWSSLRPQGTIDRLNVKVRYWPVSDKMDIDAVATKWPQQQSHNGQPITVNPQAFPYHLNDVHGEVRYRNGLIQFTSLSGQHNNARVTTSGFCQMAEDGSWRLQFSQLNTEGLTVDRDLVSALPEPLAAGIAPLNIQGPLTVTGAIEFRQGPRPEDVVASDWDLNFDLENGQTQCGVSLDNIHGSVRLTGGNNAKGFYSRGEINLDSVMFQGFQFTRVTGPVWIDSERVALGGWAEQPQPGRQPRRLQALVLGGSVAADVHVSLENDKYFTLQAQLDQANLQDFARENLPRQRKISGSASGNLRLSGTSQGTDTLRGDGHLWLRQADIYELPVMVSLLKILKIRPLDKTAFTSSDIDFRINGEDVYLDRIVFNGDAISLKGAGEVNLDRRVNLQFYTLVGDESRRIPVIWPLMTGASRRILMIEVTGSLDNPVTTRNVLPGLNTTIERLFSEELGAANPGTLNERQQRGQPQRASDAGTRYQR